MPLTDFVNGYESTTRAEAYSKLEFANTYHFAFRDLPDIFRLHVKGTAALDFGCGTGRSARFLSAIGFEVVGVDISAEMVAKVRAIDPHGDYRLTPGDPVKIITTDFEDGSPVVDILWPNESYLEGYGRSGREVVETRKPVAKILTFIAAHPNL